MVARRLEEYTTESPFQYTYEKEYRNKREIRRKNRLYFLKQKISGLILIGISVIVPMILDGDITVSIMIFPLGVFLVLTRQKVMEFEGK